MIEEQLPREEAIARATSEEIKFGLDTGTNRGQEDGQDEINTFLETITNLEAFDLKMKEVSEHGGNGNKSLLQLHQKGTISGVHT